MTKLSIDYLVFRAEAPTCHNLWHWLGLANSKCPFVLQEYQRPSTLRSTEHMHANLSDVQSRGHHLQEYPITGGPLHSTGGMHAYTIYLVCKAGDTLATTCHSLWHCRGFNGLPNPLGPILQIYPNSISTAQGPHKRPEHPSHFHHHYQHLCSTLVR